MAGCGLLSLGGYALDLHALFGTELRVLGIYVGLFAALFALYLLAAWMVLRPPADDPPMLALVLGFGLLFRLAVLPGPVVLSSDLYRYLWDGRVQWAGINPYRHPPAAPELAPLRDATTYPNINRPTKRTVYPPGAQATFAGVAAVAPNSVGAWRLFVLACEITTGLLLLRLLGRLGQPRVAVILYAWAPLAIFEGVQAGHVDAAMLPALLLALLWRQHGHMGRAGAALGVAILIKLYPAVLLPAWWRRGEWTFPTACAAVVAAGYLPYVAGAGRNVLGFLPEYFGRAEDFNIGLRYFLTEAIGLRGDAARAAAMLALVAAVLVVLVRVQRRLREDARGVFQAGAGAAAAYLVLLPTAMHPWYALWMLPFLAIAPSAAWLWFTGAVTLSYLGYVWQPAPFPGWVRALEFLPLYGLLLWDARARLGAGSRAGTRGGAASSRPASRPGSPSPPPPGSAGRC